MISRYFAIIVDFASVFKIHVCVVDKKFYKNKIRPFYISFKIGFGGVADLGTVGPLSCNDELIDGSNE